MTHLSDETVGHLRRVLAWPEVPGDRYHPVEEIGQGGMGTVYRATDQVLGRDVALKVVRPEMADEALAERLRREARILARLEHPGVVPIHDAGTLADGRVFYVMKLVRGTRLDEFLASRSRSERLRIFLRVLETVGFAHAHGVIHRDLKPANIMVGAFGEVLVLDWGIARILEEGEGSGPAVSAERPAGRPGDTAPGMVLGTPGFIAPEQARGESGALDHRADIYSLGAILRHVAGAAPVPPALASIMRRALAADPGDRYPGAAEFGADVHRFLDGEAPLAHRESLRERIDRWYRRYQTPILLVLAYVIMRLTFLAVRGF